ncbi:hypothetical protein BXZ70DRAFT_578829 [Cristinia sonorae]|uniref:Uncharacterized protein n=1 Tax=Cristinia sonorae TaxID=1940300 RepID=A0A8K0UFX2_9AGAR|nr:hypothetical protein BXZ70DRAFT_578829 [Cristinia sonorae]
MFRLFHPYARPSARPRAAANSSKAANATRPATREDERYTVPGGPPLTRSFSSFSFIGPTRNDPQVSRRLRREGSAFIATSTESTQEPSESDSDSYRSSDTQPSSNCPPKQSSSKRPPRRRGHFSAVASDSEDEPDILPPSARATPATSGTSKPTKAQREATNADRHRRKAAKADQGQRAREKGTSRTWKGQRLYEETIRRTEAERAERAREADEAFRPLETESVNRQRRREAEEAAAAHLAAEMRRREAEEAARRVAEQERKRAAFWEGLRREQARIAQEQAERQRAARERAERQRAEEEAERDRLRREKAEKDAQDRLRKEREAQQVQASAEAWYKAYNAKWAMIQDTNSAVPPLLFSEIPWPLPTIVQSIADINYEAVKFFVFYPTRPGFEGAPNKKRVRSDMLKFHPDKFVNTTLPRVHPADREAVAEAGLLVSKILSQILTEAR